MSTEVQGLRVLVVDLEQMLCDAGCEVAGPIGDLPSALRAAEEGRFDLALLDVNIGGQPVTAVADALIARTVPIVFCTGYQAASLPARYPGAPTLRKPYQATDVIAALRRAAAERTGTV